MSSTPLTYKNKGITVIGPAKTKNRLRPGLDILKSLKPALKLDKKQIKQKEVYINFQLKDLYQYQHQFFFLPNYKRPN